MTPKEKAKELINKFSDNVIVYYTEDSVPCMLNAPMVIKSRKKLALICVDEIFSVITFDGIHDPSYWNQVKQEIEAL